ncbi:MAG: FAD-dependent monooxygenase [Parvibaculales bacterium]
MPKRKTDKSGEMSFDVLVVGAGLAGQAAALALAHAGARIGLIGGARKGGLKTTKNPAKAPASNSPKQPISTDDYRVTALSPASVIMLETLTRGSSVLGLDWRASPVTHMQVSDGHPDTGLLAGGLSLQGDTKDPHLAYIVRNQDLLSGLTAAIKATPNITPITDQQVVEIAAPQNQQAPIGVVLADGQCYGAQLVVGADGRQSFVRQHMGSETVHHDYQTTALVTTITHTAPHHQKAFQLFRPQGPLASLPLSDTQMPDKRKGQKFQPSSSLVWPEQTEYARALMTLSPDELKAEINQRFDGLLGEITSIAPPTSFPLSLMVAQDYVGTRCVLLGEAAHIIHPLAGQGFNLSLRDAAMLADCWFDARRLGLDPGAPLALAPYQALRRRDALAMSALTHSLSRLFGQSGWLVPSLRKLGLSLSQGFAPMQRLARNFADTGLGSPPRLLRGDDFTA